MLFWNRQHTTWQNQNNHSRTLHYHTTYWMTKISLRLKKNEEYLEVKIHYSFSAQYHIIFYLPFWEHGHWLSYSSVSTCKELYYGLRYFCHCLQGVLKFRTDVKLMIRIWQAMMAIYVQTVLHLVPCVYYCLFYFETALHYVALVHLESTM